MPSSPATRLRRNALATFGAVALSLSACEGTSEIPAYGLPGIPPADAAADADASRRDAALAFPPGPDAEADATTDAPNDASDASIDGGAD